MSVPVRRSIRTDGSFVTKNGVITEEGRESMSFGRIFLSTWIGEQFSQNFQKTARVTLCTPFHSCSYDYLLANATPEIVTNHAGVPKFHDDEIMFVEHNGELLLFFFFFNFLYVILKWKIEIEIFYLANNLEDCWRMKLITIMRVMNKVLWIKYWKVKVNKISFWLAIWIHFWIKKLIMI